MAKKKSKKLAKKNGGGAHASSDDTDTPHLLRPHELVLAAANAVEDVMSDFPAFVSFARNGVIARVESKHAAQLDDTIKDAIVELFEANMKTQYEGSDWGYDAAAKKRELFEDDARYLLALDVENCGALLGFVHFRFVDDDEVEVLYVYEIQVAERAQRRGLGKFLMQILLLVARKQCMKLVVLTVFKRNTSALAFYREKMGFAIDETSPSTCGDQSQSYEILSKAVGPTLK